MDKELCLVYGAKVTSDKNGYIVTFRDLKNVFAEGDSRIEALNQAQEVLDILLAEMAYDGLEIPDPTPLRKGEVPVAASPKVAVPILLRKIRKQHHYSMNDVAQSMGVSYQNYQQIETGKNMTLNSLRQASAALNAVPVVKFYVREPDHHYQVIKEHKKKRKKEEKK